MSHSNTDYVPGEIPGECPTPVELGNSGWNILHSAAAVYPYKPSPEQQVAMRNFIHGWSYTYACNWCAYHMRLYLKNNEPDVTNKLTVTKFMCELHNNVNEHIGKDLYPCDDTEKLLRRWHPGYPDNMADKPSMEQRVAEERARMQREAEASAEARQAQEQRLFSFGLFNPKEERQSRGPQTWREGNGFTDNNMNNSSHSSAAAAQPGDGRKRWWFFGSAAFDAQKAAPTSTAPPADSAAASQGSGEGSNPRKPAVVSPLGNNSNVAAGPKKGKASDDETDVDAVLARLRGCQVYCPEDEQLSSSPKFGTR